ncbi:MAG: tRNA (adenosine(37)-N6)-dimethylallyltransferase MiaA [Paracoccaceae bacterium]
MIHTLLQKISPDAPVLIAGPTASGKSALALALAESQGGTVINADASQVYACWRILTARPSAQEEARAAHALYGHLAYDSDYSVGHWLREVENILATGTRPIIIGGTGLYFTAITEGLSDIPTTPPNIRDQADALTLDVLRGGVAKTTLAGLDQANRARVQRAWEVERATGRPLHEWQAQKSKPLLSGTDLVKIVMDAPKDWLTPRIEARFSSMLHTGALDEVAAMEDRYDPALPAFRAIGVDQCRAVLNGDLDKDAAAQAASIATRQYAKRQRTWFRARMSDWKWVPASDLQSP